MSSPPVAPVPVAVVRPLPVAPAARSQVKLPLAVQPVQLDATRTFHAVISSVAEAPIALVTAIWREHRVQAA
jgi:hypothetical protein